MKRAIALGLSWVMAATSVWSVAPVHAAGPAARLRPILALASPLAALPVAATPMAVAPAASATPAAACDWTVLTPTRFLRTKGAPNTYTTTFDVPGWVTTPQLLKLRNGEANGAFRVSSATVKVNGATVFGPSDFKPKVATLERPVTLTPRTTLIVTLASAPGSYLTIDACGSNGDLTAPAVAIADPTPGAFLADPTPRLRVTYQDVAEGLVSGADPSTLIVKVDGVDRTALFTKLSSEATAEWPSDEPLAPGMHAIEVEVRDRAGNRAAAQASFTVDTASPQIAVAEPVGGASLSTESPSLRITYGDDFGLDLSTLRIRVDGVERTAEFVVAPGEASATLSLPAGPHLVLAEVADRAGNRSTASASFSLDVTPPTISITEPAAGARLGADLVAVIVRYSDDQALDETTVSATLDTAPLELSVGTDTAMTVAGPLADGPHVIEVRVRDRAGNEGVATAAFSVDTTAPDIRVADPFAGALLNTATPPVKVVYADAQGLDLSSLRIRIAGEDRTDLFGVGSDEATLGATPVLPEGEVAIEATIADLTGNRSTVTTSFTVDTVAPTASLEAPTAGSFVSMATPDVRFALSDAAPATGVDATSVRVFVDGADATGSFVVSPGLVVGVTSPLSEGEHTVQVTLRDLAGNAGEVAGAFVVDLTPPVVSLVSPARGTVGNDATPELRLSLADLPGVEGVTPSGIDPSTLRVYAQSPEVPELEVTFTVSGGEAVAALEQPLPDGTTRLRIVLADIAGNHVEAAFAFDVDTVAPGLFVDAPAAAALLATAQPVLALRYTDDRSGVDVARLVVRVDGVDVSEVLERSEAAATGVVPALGEGSHTLEAEIADRAGNVTAVGSHAFTVDTVAPIVSLPMPLAGAYVGTSTAAVQVAWGDATTGVDPPTVRAWIDGIELPVAGATAEGVAFATPPVSDGAHVVRVAVADRAGNVGEGQVGFFTDTTPPAVPVVEPSDGSYLPRLNEHGQLEITGQASDLDPSLTVQCQVGDAIVTATLADGAFACAVPLAEGENDVTVTARDGNGHETTRTRTLHLDTRNPEVAIREPLGDAITAATAVDVVVDVTDASPVTATVDGSEATAAACTPGEMCPFTATGVAVGAGPFETLTATATDAAGHAGSGTVRLRVDRDVPVIEIARPPADSFASGASLEVEGTVADASAVLVQVNGIPAEVSGGGGFSGALHTHAFRVTVPVMDGSASLEVVAWDEAGNTSSAQQSVTVDSVPPVLAIVAPVSGFATRAASVEIRGTVADATAVTVTVDGAAASLAGGEFAFTAALPAEGPRTFVVRAVDAAGNASEASVPVVVDRTPPSLTIAAPEEGAVVLALPLSLSGTISDATGVVLLVNGALATVEGSAWSAQVTLEEGRRTVEVVATDAAGNETRLTRSVLVDQFAPELTVTAPTSGLLTREASVEASGSVRDSSAVTVTVDGVAAAVTGTDGGTCTGTCTFVATVALAEGDSQVLVVATDEAGRVSETAVPVTRDSTPPTLALEAPEKISAGRPGQAIAALADNLGLQRGTLSARVSAECALGVVDGTTGSLVLGLVVPECAGPGDSVTVTLEASDHAGNTASTSRVVRVVADGAIAGQALDAATGLPLPATDVQVSPSVPSSAVVSTDAVGRYALPATDQHVILRLAKDGYTSVERVVEVASGQGTVAVDAFLTPLSSPLSVAAGEGAVHVHVPRAPSVPPQAESGSCTASSPSCTPAPIRLDLPPGTYQITGLSPQALPNLLPLGWSALAALDLAAEAGVSPSTLTVEGVTGDLHLARYSTSLHAWVLEASSLAVVDGVATAPLPGAGTFAVVAADAVEPPLAVPAPGEVFEGLSMVPLPAAAASEGSVTPPVIPPTGGTATGAIEITGAEGVPSGTVVQAEVKETYTLTSGEEASTEPRTFDIMVARQRAVSPVSGGTEGGTCTSTAPSGALCASFPMTPSRVYAPAELTSGRVDLDILAGRESVRGTVGGGSEAVTLTAGDVAVAVPQGALAEDLAFAVEQHALSSFLPSNAGVVPLAELTFDASGATLQAEAQVTVAAAIAAGDSAVLARVDRQGGIPYLVVVALFDVEADRVISRPVLGLPGVREGGRYVAYRIAGPVAFVSGTTTAAAAPVQARVIGSSLPFHAHTRADGTYVIAVAPGANQLQATVPGTSLAGQAAVHVPGPPDAVPPTPIALAGVVTTAAVTPADGSVAVVRTTSVTIEAQASIAATSVTPESLRIVDDTTDQLVATRFVLSGSGRTLSVIPLQALAYATRYRLEAPGLRDTFGGLVQVPLTRFTTKADTPPVYDYAAIRFGYPSPDGLVQVTAAAGTLPPGTQILIINAGNGAVVTFTADNDGALGLTFPAEFPGTISDTLYVTVTDPLGNVTTFTRSEYVAEDGTTGIGPGGGTVRGEGGVELRVPEGALKNGATFKLALVDPSELPTLFPNAQHETLATSLGAHHGSVVRLEASEGTRLEKEADLVFQLPDFTAVPEAERPTKPEDAFYYIHRRVERCADGSTTCPAENRIVVFEVIDEAKVEGTGANARIVTASPPFFAVFGPLAGVLLLYTMSWSYDAALVGRPKPGLVTGKVLRTKWGSTGTEFEPQSGVAVSATDQAGESLATVAGGTYAVTQQDGTFALWDNRYTGGTVEVVAEVEGNEVARGRAYEAVDPTLDRYQYKATVNLTLPAVEPPPAPPAVEIIVKDAASNREIGGVAVAGTPLAISFRSTTSVLGASVNGSGYSVTMDGADETLYRVAETVTADLPGNFTIVAVAEASTGTLEVSRTVRVIAAGGKVDTLPDAAPVVTQIVPRGNAKGVAVSSLPQVFFSEPVRNIRDAATANLTLVEVDASGGELDVVPVVLSGVDPDGLPVDQITTASQAVTSVTVQPLAGLKYGTSYRLKLGTAIVDLDPDPKPLVAYESDFTTFGPVGIGESKEQAGSAGIVVMGERAYLTRTNAFVNTNLLVYDVADPVEPVQVGESQVFAPVPYDIVGEDQGEKLVAVALGSGSRSKPATVAFFDVTTDDPLLVGVSTVADSAFDGFISRIALKGGLLFSATVRKGIQAIDVSQARQAWDALGGDSLKQQKALAKVNTDGEGFGQEAVVLTIPLAPKENGTHYWLADIKAGEVQGQTLAVVTGEPGLLVASPAMASLIYQGAPQAADGFKLVWGQALALGRLSDQDVAVVVTRTHLVTVSLAEPAQPVILGYVNLAQALAGLTAVDVILRGDVALVGAQAQGQGAVIAVNLTDLSHPVVSGRLDGMGGRLALGDNDILFSTDRSVALGASTELGGVKTAALGEMAIITSINPHPVMVSAGLEVFRDVDFSYKVIPPADAVPGEVKIAIKDAQPVASLPAPLDTAGRGTTTWGQGTIVDPARPYEARLKALRDGQEVPSFPKRIRFDRLPLAITTRDRLVRIQFALPEQGLFTSDRYSVRVFVAGQDQEFGTAPAFTVTSQQIEAAYPNTDVWFDDLAPGAGKSEASWVTRKIERMELPPGSDASVRRQAFEIGVIFGSYPKIKVDVIDEASGVQLVEKLGIVTANGQWAEIIGKTNDRVRAAAGHFVPVEPILPAPNVFDPAKLFASLGGLTFRALYWVLEQNLDAALLKGLIDGFHDGWEGDKQTVSMLGQAAASPIETAKALAGFLKDFVSSISSGPGISGILTALMDKVQSITMPTVGEAAYYTGYLLGFVFEQVLVGVALTVATAGIAVLVAKAAQALKGVGWLASLAARAQRLMRSLALVLNGALDATINSQTARTALAWLKELGMVIDDLWAKYPNPSVILKRAGKVAQASKVAAQRAIYWLTVVDRMSDAVAMRFIRFFEKYGAEVGDAWLTRWANLTNGKKAVKEGFEAYDRTGDLAESAHDVMVVAADRINIPDITPDNLVQKYASKYKATAEGDRVESSLVLLRSSADDVRYPDEALAETVRFHSQPDVPAMVDDAVEGTARVTRIPCTRVAAVAILAAIAIAPSGCGKLLPDLVRTNYAELLPDLGTALRNLKVANDVAADEAFARLLWAAHNADPETARAVIRAASFPSATPASVTEYMKSVDFFRDRDNQIITGLLDQAPGPPPPFPQSSINVRRVGNRGSGSLAESWEPVAMRRLIDGGSPNLHRPLTKADVRSFGKKHDVRPITGGTPQSIEADVDLFDDTFIDMKHSLTEDPYIRPEQVDLLEMVLGDPLGRSPIKRALFVTNAPVDGGILARINAANANLRAKLGVEEDLIRVIEDLGGFPQ